MRKVENVLRHSIFHLLFCLGIGTVGTAQINLKVGYAYSYLAANTSQEIFDQFNDQNPQAEKILLPPNNLHGIDLGFRYKYKNIGIDVGLTSVVGNTESLNVIQLNGGLGDNDWSVGLVNYALGLENYFGNLGIGASLGTQRLRYRSDFGSNRGKSTLYNVSALNSKLYLIIEVPSNKIAFSIKPFISTTWEPYNFQALQSTILPNNPIDPTSLEENLMVFGFSFIFYNGPQKR